MVPPVCEPIEMESRAAVNDEIRMTNDERSPKSETRTSSLLVAENTAKREEFGFRYSGFFRNLSFLSESICVHPWLNCLLRSSALPDSDLPGAEWEMLEVEHRAEMETRLLKMFCAVAENGGLGAASNQLHLTPSAISHGLKSLE